MSPSQNKSGRNPLVNFAANLFPWQQKKPSIVEYVDRGVRPGILAKMKKIEKDDLHPLRNLGILATVSACCLLVACSSARYLDSIEAKYRFKELSETDLSANKAAKTQLGAMGTTLGGLGSLASFVRGSACIGGSLAALTLAQRKKRGEDAAESLFDGVVTDDGLFNGSELLTALQNFYATRKLFENDADPAVISYVENGDAAIGSILSLFNGDGSNILTEAKAKLIYYNDLPTDEDKKQYFPDLTAQFADPKFVDALALGIFNGDDHQELVDALAQYGDKDKLYEALFDLCTNATIVVDVVNKLQERIADALPKNIKECREILEIRRNNLIKNHPDIAKGYQLEISVDDIVCQIEKDRSGILNEANNNLGKYNGNRYNNQYRKKFFDDLTAKFADPKFIRALALGIFNGDDHQDLVFALKKYGDGNKLDEELVNLSTNVPKIYAVNAAFAALNISGVVNLPSKANDDNPEAQWDARLAALETGIEVARAALNPQQQATMARLEREVREGLGGGR
jgi:hypothetical protein